jgi:peptidyl-prolyl cis-trans isomerase SurA
MTFPNMFNFHLRLLALFLLGLSGLFPAPAQAQSVQRVVATVNDEPITIYDLKQRIGFAVATSRSRRSRALTSLVMKQLIDEKLKLQAAKSEGIEVTDEQVKESLNTIAKRNKLTYKKLKRFLSSRGVGAKTLEEKIRAELAWGEVIRRKFRSLISIGSSDVELELSKKEKKAAGEAKKAKKDKQVVFELTRLTVLFTRGRTDKEVHKRMIDAEKLRAAFKTCRRWKGEARKYRNIKHKHIQAIKADDLKDPLKSILLKTEPGQVTPATIGTMGIEIVAVCNRKDVSVADNRRKTVENQLKNQQFNQYSQRYIRDLRRDAVIEFPGRNGKKSLKFKPSQF